MKSNKSRIHLLPVSLAFIVIFLSLSKFSSAKGDSLETAFETYKRQSLTKQGTNPEKIPAVQDLWSEAYEKQDQAIDATSIALANSHFAYLGVPINPSIISEFLPWVSDRYPSVMSMDIGASQFSNRYHAGQMPLFNESGYVRASMDVDGSTFAYKWLGMLSNGTHVLKVYEDTAGSAVFSSLVLVSFKLKTIGFPRPRTQLLMVNEAVIGIGDRARSLILLDHKENKIHLEVTSGNTTDMETKRRTIDVVRSS